MFASQINCLHRDHDQDQDYRNRTMTWTGTRPKVGLGGLEPGPILGTGLGLGPGPGPGLRQEPGIRSELKQGPEAEVELEPEPGQIVVKSMFSELLPPTIVAWKK